MIWQRSHRFDPRALALADRHYSRQKPGTPQFVKAGSCAVFYAETDQGRAVWVSVWQQYVKHAWPGAWECAMFRNEGAAVSSDLIRQAVAATRAHYGPPPSLGMITFVDPGATSRRRSRQGLPGQCFYEAGFALAGSTPSGLDVLRLTVDRVPPPQPLAWAGPALFGAAA